MQHSQSLGEGCNMGFDLSIILWQLLWIAGPVALIVYGWRKIGIRKKRR